MKHVPGVTKEEVAPPGPQRPAEGISISRALPHQGQAHSRVSPSAKSAWESRAKIIALTPPFPPNILPDISWLSHAARGLSSPGPSC